MADYKYGKREMIYLNVYIMNNKLLHYSLGNFLTTELRVLVVFSAHYCNPHNWYQIEQ